MAKVTRSVSVQKTTTYILEVEDIEKLILADIGLSTSHQVSFNWSAHSGCVFQVEVTSVEQSDSEE